MCDSPHSSDESEQSNVRFAAIFEAENEEKFQSAYNDLPPGSVRTEAENLAKEEN